MNHSSIHIIFHSDQKAQPWGGPKADISEAFRPTGNGGAGAEPPLTIILIKSHLTVRREPLCAPPGLHLRIHGKVLEIW